MKIVLIKKVEKLGNIGEIKEVKPGFGRNFLLTQKLAVLPNDPRVKEINAKIIEEKKKSNGKKDKLVELAKKISGKKFTFRVKADKSGKLYGSIGAKEISKATGMSKDLIDVSYKKLGKFDLELKPSDQKIKVQIEIIKL